MHYAKPQTTKLLATSYGYGVVTANKLTIIIVIITIVVFTTVTTMNCTASLTFPSLFICRMVSQLCTMQPDMATPTQ